MKVLIDSKNKSIKIYLIESFWSLNQFIRNILEKKWNRQKYIDEIRLGTFKVKLGRKTRNYFKPLDMIPTIIFADSLDSNLLQIWGHFLKKYEIPKCKNCKNEYYHNVKDSFNFLKLINESTYMKVTPVLGVSHF